MIDLSQAFACIPLLHGYDVDDFTISHLPGYTNCNYRLYNQRFDWVLRIPRPATNGFIDRDAVLSQRRRHVDNITKCFVVGLSPVGVEMWPKYSTS